MRLEKDFPIGFLTLAVIRLGPTAALLAARPGSSRAQSACVFRFSLISSQHEKQPRYVCRSSARPGRRAVSARARDGPGRRKDLPASLLPRACFRSRLQEPSPSAGFNLALRRSLALSTRFLRVRRQNEGPVPANLMLSPAPLFSCDPMAPSFAGLLARFSFERTLCAQGIETIRNLLVSRRERRKP
jgi:hypothetical protein